MSALTDKIRKTEQRKEKKMRWIGIRHRRKKTTKGQTRPTQVAVLSEEKKITTYDLPDEVAELDWIMGRFPTKYRKPNSDEKLSQFPPHQIKWRRLRRNENPKDFPRNLVRGSKKEHFLAIEVPASYDGLKPGDVVAMILGGSGDRLAFALSRRAEQIKATVLRIPGFKLKEIRNEEKEQDAITLAKLAKEKPSLFYSVEPRDRQLIWLVECLRARQEAMKARIGCEQRLYQSFVGKIFCGKNGLFPEGSIEMLFDQEKANNTILQALLEEEKSRKKELVSALEALDVYQQIFAPIKGMGPMIAARLIAAIQDIRRFETPAQLKAFCGVHVLPDGRFARRRRGAVANWHPDARQALFLLGEQFNRRPDSQWGSRLREYKKKFRQKHPEVVLVNGKKRYTDGHIHKMAIWRTLTKFVEYLWRTWWKLEKQLKD